MKYYKIYHYSSIPGLKKIDPAFYGSGVTSGSECRRGKTGLNKSYFYTVDSPETCVVTPNRYEIYLPYEWKSKIYDRSKDPENLYEKVKIDIKKKENRNAYEYELAEGVEKYIKELGYKGWNVSEFTPLPHVIVLFYDLSTEKPYDFTKVYDWSDRLIEKNNLNKGSASKISSSFNFFKINENDNNWQKINLNNQTNLPVITTK